MKTSKKVIGLLLCVLLINGCISFNAFAYGNYYYTITGSSNDGGTISSITEAAEGDTGEITVKADEGYKLIAILLDGVTVDIAGIKNDTYTIKDVQDDMEVRALFIKDQSEDFASKFTDVSKTDANGDTTWYYDAVNMLVGLGIVEGTSDTTFAPDANVKRSEMTKFLFETARVLGLDVKETDTVSFTDMPSENYWGIEYIGWASDNDIVKGYNSNQFGPEDEVIRQDSALMMQRFFEEYLGYELPGDIEITFGDQNQISDYAVDAVNYVVRTGLMQGDEQTNFNPQNSSLRSQVVTILYNFLIYNNSGEDVDDVENHSTTIDGITGYEYYVMGYVYKQAGEYELAAKCFKMSAILGDGQGTNQLAELVYGGKVELEEGQDQTEEAFYWWYKSIEYGYPRANYSMGLIYLGNSNIPGAGANLGTIEQDDAVAFDYFLKGSDGGDNKSARMVAWCYETGRCVEQNDELAVYYYKLACDRLDSTGAIKYAGYLVTGQGVEQDVATAIEIYLEMLDEDGERYAAASGSDIASAAYAMAKLYEEGTYVTADMDTAISYYLLASNGGNNNAVKWVTEYAQSLYDEGIALSNDMDGLAILYKAAELGNEDALAFFGA